MTHLVRFQIQLGASIFAHLEVCIFLAFLHRQKKKLLTLGSEIMCHDTLTVSLMVTVIWIVSNCLSKICVCIIASFNISRYLLEEIYHLNIIRIAQDYCDQKLGGQIPILLINLWYPRSIGGSDLFGGGGRGASIMNSIVSKQDWKPFQPPRRQEGLKYQQIPFTCFDLTLNRPKGPQLDSNRTPTGPQLDPNWTLAGPQQETNWTLTVSQLYPNWTPIEVTFPFSRDGFHEGCRVGFSKNGHTIIPLSLLDKHL